MLASHMNEIPVYKSILRHWPSSSFLFLLDIKCVYIGKNGSRWASSGGGGVEWSGANGQVLEDVFFFALHWQPMGLGHLNRSSLQSTSSLALLLLTWPFASLFSLPFAFPFAIRTQVPPSCAPKWDPL